MSYCGYITKLQNVRPHSNADRMKLADCFGNTVCVGIDTPEDTLLIYFPTDGQLSAEYCEHNNLVRKKDENGNNIGGYMDPDKRNVTAIKLRGEKSDGLVMPLESLAFTGVDISTFKMGDTITVVNGHEICKKYIPVNKKAPRVSEGNRTRKKKVPIAPLFAEHADTEQLAYNMDAFKPGDEIEITLKMHGTSQRTGYLPVISGYTGPGWAMTVIKHPKLFKRLQDKAMEVITPLYDWGYVSGTRRTVLENFDGGFYGSNAFRKQHEDLFRGKLWKGETVYYEVVGFTDDGAPIMASCSNKKLNDKEFVKKYGDTTVFSYGCSPTGTKRMVGEDADGRFMIDVATPKSDVYVYRMTMTNEDGNIVEYTPNFMRYRCELMGVKCVPVMWKGTIPNENYLNSEYNASAGEYIKMIAEQFYDGPDPIGKTHVREGVVIRIVNRPKFCAYKHKNWYFKALEGIVKVDAEAPDMEEADGMDDGQN